ncbi:MAG TPA: DUF167 domain-containing protein [Methylomirabilota bacterium]|jgi:hypothetical protein|nr:DUF167 domain-containing protein [Methylomirabilota bacterium]
MPAAARAEGSLLHVRVQPRARRNEVLGWQGRVLRVRVTAAPEAGEANRAVTELLADAFDVPRSSVELVRGGASRDKLFRVRHLSLDALRARLGDPST